MRYSVFAHSLDEDGYEFLVPDFSPHCTVYASSLDQGLEAVKENMELYIEGLLIDEETIPSATSIDVLRAEPQYSDGVWIMVDVDISSLSGKAKRINVTLPERLLTQVDKFATSRGETRSGFLAQAALKYMSQNR